MLQKKVNAKYPARSVGNVLVTYIILLSMNRKKMVSYA